MLPLHRKREHAVAFKSMLRLKGIRVVSITEDAGDSPTGKLMEAIIESVDEFYSENLAPEVTQGMREAASRGFFSPPLVRSKFLLSGLLRCGHCGRPYIGQGAKSGQFAHYVCNTLHREGAGACQARYLSAPRLEQFVVEKMKELILTDETITELVTLVSEEVSAMAGEFADKLKVIKAELADVQNRLGRLYDALETSRLALDALSPPVSSS